MTKLLGTDNRIGPDGVRILLEPLIANGELKELDLSCNPSIPSKRTALETLFLLLDNFICGDGAKIISELIKKTPSLETLKLSGKYALVLFPKIHCSIQKTALRTVPRVISKKH